MIINYPKTYTCVYLSYQFKISNTLTTLNSFYAIVLLDCHFEWHLYSLNHFGTIFLIYLKNALLNTVSNTNNVYCIYLSFTTLRLRQIYLWSSVKQYIFKILIEKLISCWHLWYMKLCMICKIISDGQSSSFVHNLYIN